MRQKTKAEAIWRSSAVVGLVALVLVVGGCADGGAKDGSIKPEDLYGTGGVTPVVELDIGDPILIPEDDIPLPISGGTVPEIHELYGLTLEQELVVAQAEYEFLKACMAGKGFTLLDAEPVIRTTTRSYPYDPYIGILDPAYAMKFGYQLDSEEVFPPPAAGEVLITPPKGYELAMDSCGGQATDRLYENLPNATKSSARFIEIERQAMEMSLSSEEYLSAQGAWSKCMVAKGFDYATPQEVMERYTAFSVTAAMVKAQAIPTASEEEKATGVADVACKTESGLYLTWRRLYWDYQLELEAEDLPVLEAAREETRVLVARAQQMLAEVGVSG
jgi:hypothetical protein